MRIPSTVINSLRRTSVHNPAIINWVGTKLAVAPPDTFVDVPPFTRMPRGVSPICTVRRSGNVVTFERIPGPLTHTVSA